MPIRIAKPLQMLLRRVKVNHEKNSKPDITIFFAFTSAKRCIFEIV